MIPSSGSQPWPPDHPRTFPRTGSPTPPRGARPLDGFLGAAADNAVAVAAMPPLGSKKEFDRPRLAVLCRCNQSILNEVERLLLNLLSLIPERGFGLHSVVEALASDPELSRCG